MLAENTYATRDGTDLYLLCSLPNNPKAILIFIHGLGEHIGRYKDYFAFFHKNEIGCVGFDLRGHGKSDGQRGHSPGYEYLMDDIQEIASSVNQSYSETPLFIYGHSMGGNLGLNFLIRRNPSELRGGIITSPWIKLRIKPSSIQLLLAKIMHKIFPSFSERNSLDPAHLSRDSEIGETYQQDPLVHDKISAGLFTEMVEAGRFVLDHAQELKLPVLLIHGEADPITSPEASKSFADKTPDCVKFQPFPDMLHETHNEIGKEQVYQTVLSWLEEKL